MNLVALAPLWLVIVLAAALCAAAIEDSIRLRISNLTCIVVLAAAVLAAALAGFDLALWQNVAVFVVVLALGTVAFGAGWLGGGDVKLLAATALWFDIRSAISFVAVVLIAGGLLGLGFIIVRLLMGKGMTHRKSKRVPYGIAIALGALLMIALDRRQPAQPAELDHPIPIKVR